MNTDTRYSPEVQERSVQRALEHQDEHGPVVCMSSRFDEVPLYAANFATSVRQQNRPIDRRSLRKCTSAHDAASSTNRRGRFKTGPRAGLAPFAS